MSAVLVASSTPSVLRRSRKDLILLSRFSWARTSEERANVRASRLARSESSFTNFSLRSMTLREISRASSGVNAGTISVIVFDIVSYPINMPSPILYQLFDRFIRVKPGEIVRVWPCKNLAKANRAIQILNHAAAANVFVQNKRILYTLHRRQSGLEN